MESLCFNKNVITDIPDSKNFSKICQLTKGLSGDAKYYVETINGQRIFLRLSDISELNRKKSEYTMMEKAYEYGFPTSQPLAFGICDRGKCVYSMTGWLEGKSADLVLPFITETEQFLIGIKSGKTIRKLHEIPASINIESWGVRFRKKVHKMTYEYQSKSQKHSEIGEMLIEYLKNNIEVVDSRTSTFIHGDYNIENIIIISNEELYAIDFNCFSGSYTDPWWDLNNMAWMPVMFSSFYTGQIKGYFDGEPPSEFWNILSCYLAYDALAALTNPLDLNGLEDGTQIVNNIMKWTHNFNDLIPTWYIMNL